MSNSNSSQPNFGRAYEKLIELLNTVQENNYVELVKYFFEIGQNYGQPAYNPIIETFPATELKKLIYDLTKEVVNLDMCFYMTQNINPRLSEKFKQKIVELSR